MCPAALAEVLTIGGTVSPYDEALAYEYLYSLPGATLKRIADGTVKAGKLPTQVVEEVAGLFDPPGMAEVRSVLDSKVGRLGVAVNNTTTWPDRLADSQRPTPLLYYYGDIGLIETKGVSIVGSRKASADGVRRAARLARELAAAGVTVVSGLARGIDTAALESAVGADGRVVGVIGTPIDECYPKENRRLQELIGSGHLLVSQVPFYEYGVQPFVSRKHYFPERNELMAAISDATVIVEASDTSGTLSQARACMHQGRPLFIMRSCYEGEGVEWPKKWAVRDGVSILDDTGQLLDAIGWPGERR